MTRKREKIRPKMTKLKIEKTGIDRQARACYDNSRGNECLPRPLRRNRLNDES